MMSIDERLARIETKIDNKDFLENRGMANEIGYYIFDYDPKDELYVRDSVHNLIDRINKSNKIYKLIEFDLYEIMINYLKDKKYFDRKENVEKNYLNKIYEIEDKQKLDDVIRAISHSLGCTSDVLDKNYIAKYISERVQEHTVIILTGVGKCYPILRSHNILNVLQQAINTVPVIMFFPGKYSGQDFQLFGTIKKQNYYRAFRLVED